MDKLAAIKKVLSELTEALEAKDESLALVAAERFDKLIKSLSDKELEHNHQILTELNATLTKLIGSAHSQQYDVKKEISRFSQNTQKLKAYNIPK